MSFLNLPPPSSGGAEEDGDTGIPNIHIVPIAGGAGAEVAIEGCCHGELEKIYAALDETMERNGFKARAPLALGAFSLQS
ncbi:hypothetical protein T484DRAFT_1793486 [Baffinella frigidus]|nr:hypothetical protein T484DRAFT_1793486 [Cryptophyta sp. CCMP2293]